MTNNTHTYQVEVQWTGNSGQGTASPAAYSRNHEIRAAQKPVIEASSDPAFRGDPTRYNPEELLVASLSECHMLWFLGLCAKHKIVVTAYNDAAEGTMIEHSDGSGEFTNAILRPQIQLADEADEERADALHHEAHHMCFIARSVNFDVAVEATYLKIRN